MVKAFNYFILAIFVATLEMYAAQGIGYAHVNLKAKSDSEGHESTSKSTIRQERTFQLIKDEHRVLRGGRQGNGGFSLLLLYTPIYQWGLVGWFLFIVSLFVAPVIIGLLFAVIFVVVSSY